MKNQLVVSKDKFKIDLQLRIQKGQEVITAFPSANTEEDFSKLEKDFRRWNSYNVEWLKQSFSDVKGTPYRYVHTGILDIDALSEIQWGADSRSLEFRKRYFPGEISGKVDFLEDLLNRVELIPTIAPASEPNKPAFISQNTFSEKCSHFLRYLYENGSREHKALDVNTLTDFSNALASSAEEFHRIIESLLDEKLIRYDRKSVVSGDWINNIQAHYHNVLLTPAGKRAMTEPASNHLTKMAPNNFNFGSNTNVHLIQGDGAVQTNVIGNNANVNVAKGNDNTQANQLGQPASLQELVEQLNKEFANSIFDSHRDEINDELIRIEVQLQKAEPKKSLLIRSLDYLKDMAADSAGAVAAQTVVELIKHAPMLIAAAHLG